MNKRKRWKLTKEGNERKRKITKRKKKKNRKRIEYKR